MAVQITNADVFKAFTTHLHVDGAICFFFVFVFQDVNTHCLSRTHLLPLITFYL